MAATKKKNVKTENVTLKIKKLDNRAVIPTYAHVDSNGENEGDMGMDMTAISAIYNEQKDWYEYHTGIAIESDKHIGVICLPRSSNRKTDCYLSNSAGLIDSTIYRGEIIWCFKDRTSSYVRKEMASIKAMINELTNIKKNILHPFTIKARAIKAYNDALFDELNKIKRLEYAPYKVGDRIGQMVTINYPFVDFEIVDELSETSRGENGFGSSDNKEIK